MRRPTPIRPSTHHPPHQLSQTGAIRPARWSAIFSMVADGTALYSPRAHSPPSSIHPRKPAQAGFLDTGRIFSTIDHPSADAGGTTVNALNASAAAVGDYHDATGTHGFVLQAGIFSPVNAPAAPNATFPMAINDNGVVSGYYTVN